mmetsp:Transcript_41733/g.124805  ORF Transcript_41733/g.124805 Transcript_41733/m.124805 type:complete len:377 (-) Transcript_41733:3084-4214(-)
MGVATATEIATAPLAAAHAAYDRMRLEPAAASSASKPRQSADGQLLRQRLVVWWFCASVMGIIWSWTAVVLLFRTSTLAAAAITCYLAYVWTWGFQAAESMSWTPVLRRWHIWHDMRDYFGAELHKTAELPASQRYVFALLPHGITSLSGWVHFATDATNFPEKFPGINMRALTLDANFRAPVIREYCLLHGLRSAGRRSIRNILGSGPGSAVLLVPGGAAEALVASPGKMDVLAARRKGFVRMAIETGAHLVPVIAFGENEAFSTYVPTDGCLAARSLKALKKATGLAFPIFWGVGLTRDSWGILPRGVRLNTVVGAPLPPPPLPPGGTSALSASELSGVVDAAHSAFLAATQKLYDEHKAKYAPGRMQDMRMLA